MAGDFEAGGGFTAVDAAAAGGEDADVAAAGDEAGHADRVEAGGVHEAEAWRGDGFGVAIDGHEGGVSAFGDGAEAFLVDGGEAAVFVAAGRVIIEAGVVAAGVVFPPADEVEQAFGHAGGDGAAGEQVFGAVDFGGFGEDGGSAMADEVVRGHAEGGVGGDAAMGVGAAAIGGEDEVGEGEGGAAEGIGEGQETFHGGHAGVDGFAHSAGGLDGEEGGGEFAGAEGIEVELLAEEGDLGDFATEADEDVAGDIGVAGEAGEDALEEGEGFACGQGAAALVGEGDDAVDAGKVPGQVGAAEAVADELGDGGRAIDAGDHGEVIARAGAAAGSGVAEELAWRGGGEGGERFGLEAELVGGVQRSDLEVVVMDVVAGADGGAGEADGVTVFVDGLAGGDRAEGDLVAGRDGGGGSDVGPDDGAGRGGLKEDDDVVVVM